MTQVVAAGWTFSVELLSAGHPDCPLSRKYPGTIQWDDVSNRR